MYKQLSASRWINCKTIEVITELPEGGVHFTTRSGRSYTGEYSIEYYLDGCGIDAGPVGIEDWNNAVKLSKEGLRVPKYPWKDHVNRTVEYLSGEEYQAKWREAQKETGL